MNNSCLRTTRTTVISAVIFATLMVGIPSFFNAGEGLESAGVAAAVDVERAFTVGVVELTVSTLNPNTYTMVSEAMVIFPCYSTLLQYDVDNNIIGDLAWSWNYTPDMMTWNFRLVDNAYFVDPAEPDVKSPTRLVTAADVIWSYWALQNNTDSRLHTYLPDVIGSMEAHGNFDLTITLKRPYVAFMDALTGAPIFPKYIWASQDFTKFSNDPPIGSGSFYYSYESNPDNGIVVLKRNPIWYHEENKGWQIHVDKWILREELAVDTGWIDLQNGAIDVMLGLTPSIYLNGIPKAPQINGYAQSMGFVYEFNLNQMTDELRQELGGSFNAGWNNQLLLDPVVKEAIAMCVDKYAFVDEVLLGLGSYADSLVPETSPWHYTYPDPIEFNPAAARQMLMDAGWRYTETGDPATSTTLPLCKEGGTDPLSFRFYTLDTSPTWEDGASLIVGWCAEAGVELNLDIKSVNEMNTVWYSADYDLWLWDWIFSPISEPATGVLVVLTSFAIGTDSDVYWVNETYDQLYLEALVTMDPELRADIYNEMQAMAYENMGCQAVAYRKELYGFYNQRWTNFGDLNNSYWLLPDVWNQWLAMRMYPIENEAPNIYSWTQPITDYGEAVVGSPISFYANANDDWGVPLEYQWYWGDGTKSGWSSSGNAVHTYAKDGNYTVYVAARETLPTNGVDDYFMSYRTTYVEVYDMSNDAPYGLEITMDPSTGINSGTNVSFHAVAFDEEDQDALTYSWDFGDGHIALGQDVWHQFSEAVVDTSYTVTLSVTDGHLGTGTRPQTESVMVMVGPNHPPIIDVPDVPNIKLKESNTYTVTASDSDPGDHLRFTWYWGDGAVTVTDVPTADHIYNTRGQYTLTVWADDLTGIDGHNVSDSGTVYVYNPSKNKVPAIVSFSVDDSTPYTGQVVTFEGSAQDGDGDGLTFTFEFGDGEVYVESFGPTDPSQIVSCSAEHVYTDAGTHTAYLRVSDGIDEDLSDPMSIEVEANMEPVIVSLPDVYGSTGEVTSFFVDAYDLDPDDSLTYTWVWGDGTSTTTTVPNAEHTYDESGEYVYRVYVDDSHGHNVTSASYAWINAVPVLEPLADFSVVVGVEHTFSAVVTDPDEDDVLNYTWDFGDSSPLAYGQTVTHTYSAVGSYDFTLNVWDGFNLATHHLTDTATATVLPAGMNYPPEITPLEDVTLAVGEAHQFSVSANDPNGDPLIYTWDFGDSTGLFSGQTVSHSYAAIGDYVFTVYVDDGTENVSASGTAHVIADAAPVAVAGPDKIVDEDTLVTFDGSGSTDDVGIVSWEWEIVELSVVLEGETADYTFITPGTYTVELTVEDTAGQTDTDSLMVTVRDVTDPIAVADAAPLEIDMGGVVIFNGAGSSDNVAVTSYEWTFFDGSLITLTGVSPSYTFVAAGVFTVTLTVEDAAGNSGTDTVTITVVDTEDPVADAGADQTVGMGDACTLSGMESSDNVGIVNYTWTFDDGGPVVLYGGAVTYTFDEAGEYTITLTVVDEAGNSDTDEVTITVLDTEAPVADAGVDRSVYVGESVTFSGSGSSDNVGVVNYTWTFEDGGPVVLYGPAPSYAFETAGTFIVTLTVSDAAGNTDSDTMTVTVAEVPAENDPPVANAGTDQTVEVGELVTLNGGASTDDDSIVSYVWTFTYDGETQTLTGVTATFTFEIAGEYTITLTVTDSDGETDTDTVTITVVAGDSEEKSFLESYGLPLGIVVAVVIVALVVLMLMKKRKGGPAVPVEPAPPVVESSPPTPPADEKL